MHPILNVVKPVYRIESTVKASMLDLKNWFACQKLFVDSTLYLGH